MLMAGDSVRLRPVAEPTCRSRKPWLLTGSRQVRWRGRDTSHVCICVSGTSRMDSPALSPNA